ncbi:ABC-type transport system periplasmic substrate-binding protein (probable substrate glutamine/glutamate/polar amino acids) [Natronomonas moolapensis 8.8.11]|uniref:ABC-type transport system periplasmic substrate-binding protein (Probable substrate glutamine/glutamate/polar amino acids) n=1 Tax=Natronomonas moolapensis (strain DSM 18674 / CECT 7526 / JCM 14361 / 8.8.11) TaxID=268739 RepID=M1Y434_NATM8|nr:basic amino acid ABC transporter substrate-binding protein [Natronomonas moolapensis]CCQ37284.1 ABC-type transport system periplasmic substrate-binding protein (probable substrate glutamine/glutamate/polar amino acids) [Natronomonas moolapensis 8.8.11]
MTRKQTPNRRQYLTALGAGGVAALAGCMGGNGDGDGDGNGNGGSDGNPETVVIGSDIPYEPFEYRNEAGELLGFDVDIAEAVFADQLGLDYEFEQTGFDGIIASLNNANFRVIMSAMTINETRAEQVDFSDPYFTAYQTVLVLEGGDIAERADIQGATVGVQRGTTGEAAAEDLQSEFDGDLEIQSYDQITGAFDALLNNQVSAVINDNTVSADFAAETDGVVFLEGDGVAADRDDAPDYLTLTIEEYGIAFRQDDDEFRGEVNDALAAIREDGTYEEIYDEYFAA